tara:strand:+ start:2491 stop:2976 length:486 start_codon:yes stop_codon:yes gene_type:complete
MSFDLKKKKKEFVYYYAENDDQFGPFSKEDLLPKIDGNTLVWREGINWTNASKLDEFKGCFENNDYPKFENQDINYFNQNESTSSFSSSSVNSSMKPQNKLTMALLCFFLGYTGIHRFMMGHTAIGVLMLLTAGLCGILTLVDFIRILTGDLKMVDGRDLI